MRKIEQTINATIRVYRTNLFQSGYHVTKLSDRDEVSLYVNGHNEEIAYRLHGHVVFSLSSDGSNNETIILSDCGWRTATTKSRLNAILASFLPGYGIYQKDFNWFISDGPGVSIPFFNGLQYAI